MAKKSLIKSTTKKKKSASKKKDDEKKTKPTQKKGRVKAKVTKKSVKKKAAPKKKKLTLKDLIFKKFDIEVPTELYRVEPPGTEHYTAPPLISTTDKKEAERLKKLLFRKFDLTVKKEKKKPKATEIPETPVAKTTPEKKAPPSEPKIKEKLVSEKKEPDYKEIMSRKFLEIQPARISTEDVDKIKKERYTAPPIINTDDIEEARRLKELLFRKFDIPPSPVIPKQVVPEETPEKTEETAPLAVEPGKKAYKKPAETEPEKVTESKKPAFKKEKIKKEQEGPKVSVSYDEPPPTHTEVSEPMDKMIKYGIAVFVLIILLIIVYSFANVNNYYIKENPDGIEIWKGKFSPMGTEQLLFIPGAEPPESPKEIYSPQEVLPLAFNYQIEKADSLMNVREIPDIGEVKNNLQKALSFATTQKEEAAVETRLDALKGLVLQYRADVRAKKGAASDLTAAAKMLREALKLDLDPLQKEMIETKINNLQELSTEMKAEETKAKTEAAQIKSSPEETAEKPPAEPPAEPEPPAEESTEH